LKSRSSRCIASLKETFLYKRALAIGTVCGSIIGLIPGVGGQIAGLLAYDQSRKFSPQRDKYGTGYPEGVIAAESANNAMVGPSLVPLLTLSIPGSPTAAVLLGGLLIHGIFPGSDLFDNHPKVAWTFINSMLIGQILMVVFGIWMAASAAKVARMPTPIMAAAVLVLALFGSYSIQQSMGDVYIMLVLGMGMYFLEKFGFSAAPLVLGLILGPIAEANFIQGSMIANATDGAATYFLTGTLNLFLLALVIASDRLQLLGHHDPRQENRGSRPPSRRPLNEPDRTHATPDPGNAGSHALAATVTWLSFTREPADAFLFPRIISVVMVLLAAWNFARAALGLARVGAGFLIHPVAPPAARCAGHVCVRFLCRSLARLSTPHLWPPSLPSTRSMTRLRTPR
jgi:hypothetical protein